MSLMRHLTTAQRWGYLSRSLIGWLTAGRRTCPSCGSASVPVTKKEISGDRCDPGYRVKRRHRSGLLAPLRSKPYV